MESLPVRCAYILCLMLGGVACDNPAGDGVAGRASPSCLPSAATTTDAGGEARPRQRPLATSLLQLIANPERFDESEVSLRGYLLVKDGLEVGPLLTASPEDALWGLGNRVSVSFSQCSAEAPGAISKEEFWKHHQRRVHIYGRFLAAAPGSREPGVICSVREIVDLPPISDEAIQEICPREGGTGVCAGAALRTTAGSQSPTTR